MDSLMIGAIVGAFLVSAGFAAIIARTASSKGYSYRQFFFFGFISYLLTSVVTVFLRPKGQANAKPKVSSIALLFLGIVVEFTGLSFLPNLGTASEAEIAEMAGSQQMLGGLFVAIAGILMIIGSVANDYRGQKEEVRSL